MSLSPCQKDKVLLPGRQKPPSVTYDLMYFKWVFSYLVQRIEPVELQLYFLYASVLLLKFQEEVFSLSFHPMQVTHNQENVFDLQWMDVIVLTQEYVEPLLKNMALHLKRLIDERDEHSEVWMWVGA